MKFIFEKSRRKNDSIELIVLGIFVIPLYLYNVYVLIILALLKAALTVYRILKINNYIQELETLESGEIRIKTFNSPLFLKSIDTTIPHESLDIIDGELFTTDKGLVLRNKSNQDRFFIPENYSSSNSNLSLNEIEEEIRKWRNQHID